MPPAPAMHFHLSDHHACCWLQRLAEQKSRCTLNLHFLLSRVPLENGPISKARKYFFVYAPNVAACLQFQPAFVTRAWYDVEKSAFTVLSSTGLMRQVSQSGAPSGGIDAHKLSTTCRAPSPLPARRGRGHARAATPRARRAAFVPSAHVSTHSSSDPSIHRPGR